APIIAWGGQGRDRTARTLTRGARRARCGLEGAEISAGRRSLFPSPLRGAWTAICFDNCRPLFSKGPGGARRRMAAPNQVGLTFFNSPFCTSVKWCSWSDQMVYGRGLPSIYGRRQRVLGLLLSASVSV